MTEPRQVLVIDDEQERLDQLSVAVEQELTGVPIARWKPERDEDPLARFEALIQTTTGLIVTDHDLTKGGTGLLGSNITAWAQDRFVPVCNFSRQQQRKLPRESNFFELRVPAEPEEQARAQYIARIYRGFDTIRNHIAQRQDGAAPTAAVLADAMGQPKLQDALAPYLTSVGYANSSFMRSLHESGEAPSGQIRIDFLSFILGHILINAVLEYPARSFLDAYSPPTVRWESQPPAISPRYLLKLSTADHLPPQANISCVMLSMSA